MESHESLTIHIPARLVAKMRNSKVEEETLDDFIADAVDREIRRRVLETLAEIDRMREEIRAAHGIHPDSTPYIRQLREERASRG